ncbi:MAG: hypothetical protein H6959_09300 [Chromatiaceae bacterium]|nr:hypothetical protein [Gammaproteobacteria bacterium]MCP5298359.1 hypothetical protein [Chromatiaceae bacterium]MCP5423101.1 hypothetical protein [Chromatiaceae bacterium]
MSMGRYWIFFVIVAVGLVLSWGQVGRKTEHELRERPVDFLSVESGCDPMHAPCAAYAGERAMVLGPEQGGLLLKLAGIDPASVASVEAVLLDPGGDAAATRQLRQGNGGWVLPLSGASNASQVRISVNAGATTVADFPLHAGAADR